MKTDNLFQKIIGVLVSQDLKSIKPVELHDIISKQLKIKRDDWINVITELNKTYPIVVYDFIKQKKFKVKNLDKYKKYLKKLKSAHFKIYSIGYIYDLYQKMLNPINKVANEKIKGAKKDDSRPVE